MTSKDSEPEAVAEALALIGAMYAHEKQIRADALTGEDKRAYGLSDGGTRDYRLGWRLTPAASGDTGFEVSLDATRREAANDDADHGVMLRSRLRW